MKSVLLSERLETACQTFATLERQLADPAITGNPQRLQTIARERARLEPLVIDYRELLKLKQEQHEISNLLKAPGSELEDAELAELAKEELASLDSRIEELSQRLTAALLPSDPRDERSVMLEIRSGAGGDEASLWAGDLARMYERYAQLRQWRVFPVSASEAEQGGFKELILAIEGDGVYSQLKFEAGVHRAQRGQPDRSETM